jgi:hypothetical protein
MPASVPVACCCEGVWEEEGRAGAHLARRLWLPGLPQTRARKLLPSLLLHCRSVHVQDNVR